MKIALPSRNRIVDDHFGHCESFAIFTVDDHKQIVSEERVESPSGCGCKSNIVETLSRMGVTTMLAGNIGGGAIEVLGRHGIEVIRGCSGDVKETVQRWLDGTLADSGATCQQHDHQCHTD